MMTTDNTPPILDVDSFTSGNVNSSVSDAQGVSPSAPVLLVGAERSGSTLLRLMLDHHPALSFRGEAEFIVDEMSDDGTFPDLKAYHDYLPTQRAVRLSNLKIDPTLDYRQLVESLLRARQLVDRKPIYGATIHRNFHRLPFLWSNARYIHLYRDGRDVSKSVVQMGWAGSVYTATEWWTRAFYEWEQLKSHLRADQYLEVSYENLVCSAETELRRICQFLGIEYSEQMLDYAKTTTYSLPDESYAFQWRKKMPVRDVRRIEAKLGAMLEQRGYALSGHPPLRISTLGHWLLLLDSRLHHIGDRFRRFGPKLYLGETICRRLGLKRWAHRFRLGMDEILDREMK